MDRIEVNAVTGERTIVLLTADEIAEAQARMAKEDADRAKPKPKTLEERVAALEAKG